MKTPSNISLSSETSKLETRAHASKPSIRLVLVWVYASQAWADAVQCWVVTPQG